jgi:hypothetical protein
MPILKLVAAATVLAFSISAATACDDYAEEMAMASAQAAKVAQSPIPQLGPTVQAAGPASSPSEPASVASVQTQTIETSTATLQR